MKSEAIDCIMSFIRNMENLNEVKVKEQRSDNGTKIRNRKLEEFCDEKGISQNFSSPCTPEQNGVAERRNKTLIVARTMLNSSSLPIQFWGEAVNNICYTQNKSIIVKKRGKTSYDVFKRRSPDINYFYIFGCLVFIHNHKDDLGKFDEMADDGFFLGYSLVAKAFRVFNIRRQDLEETFHFTFNEADEVIRHTNTEGDDINFNENRSFTDDEFLVEFLVPRKPLNLIEPSPTPIPPPAEINHDNLAPQDKWSRDKHILVVNILGKPEAGVTTRSRVKDSKAALAHECLYVNFLSDIETKRWIFKNKMDENGVVIKNKTRLVAQEYRQEEWTDYDETFAPISRLEAIRIFLAYAANIGFMVYQMNVKSAFLNGNLSEEVYVQQPPGFKSSEFPNYVCKLDMALYGLKQAPRAWYGTLSKFLIQHKFIRGTIDNTLYL
ncbi:retrovirus-related pol polyprotein from transposon TNT 1-94 [Tanacetum coccineum]